MNAGVQTSSLRDAHRNLTRRRVLDAALGLFRDGAVEDLTMAGVAARAGMTERTIYRHFETREALLGAVWEEINAIVKTPSMPDTPERLIAQPREMFREFDKEEALLRAIVTTRQGRELRLSVNAQRQTAIRQAVRAARPELMEPHFTRLCAAVQLLDSSFAWAVMKDYWGLAGDEAGAAASEAIRVLLGYGAAPEDQHAKEKTP
ncbi:MAG: helix-turn-helix domain-containing protein [Hyphomonadaceae bacterium]|nr:helix-turn-helix domain-containing protein [Hyphomonadaceae bacterium]